MLSFFNLRFLFHKTKRVVLKTHNFVRGSLEKIIDCPPVVRTVLLLFSATVAIKVFMFETSHASAMSLELNFIVARFVGMTSILLGVIVQIYIFFGFVINCRETNEKTFLYLADIRENKSRTTKAIGKIVYQIEMIFIVGIRVSTFLLFELTSCLFFLTFGLFAIGNSVDNQTFYTETLVSTISLGSVRSSTHRLQMGRIALGFISFSAVMLSVSFAWNDPYNAFKAAPALIASGVAMLCPFVVFNIITNLEDTLLASSERLNIVLLGRNLIRVHKSYFNRRVTVKTWFLKQTYDIFNTIESPTSLEHLKSLRFGSFFSGLSFSIVSRFILKPSHQMLLYFLSLFDLRAVYYLSLPLIIVGAIIFEAISLVFVVVITTFAFTSKFAFLVLAIATASLVLLLNETYISVGLNTYQSHSVPVVFFATYSAGLLIYLTVAFCIGLSFRPAYDLRKLITKIGSNMNERATSFQKGKYALTVSTSLVLAILFFIQIKPIVLKGYNSVLPKYYSAKKDLTSIALKKSFNLLFSPHLPIYGKNKFRDIKIAKNNGLQHVSNK